MLILEQKLDFWIQNNQNVLFIGKHGVGKTTIVKDIFEKYHLNYRYFSASTMDPWVDFIGVPKEKQFFASDSFSTLKDLISIHENLAVDWIVSNWRLDKHAADKIVASLSQNNFGYLDLIRPKVFATGEIEALFFDEFNRSPKKVRNSVMELLQFKSINGMKFPNLKIVWAAINPEDSDDVLYDVESLDPAQKDRFHVIVEIPYRPDADWFRNKYGNKIANSAIQWWEELEDKNEVSPRRLQYALDTYLNKGDLRDVLPASSNVSKLLSSLKSGPTLDELENLFLTQDIEKATKFLSNENNFSSALRYIKKSDRFKDFFLPLLSKEKISFLLSKEDKTSNYIIKNSSSKVVFKEVCQDVVKAGTNNSLIKKIRRHFTEQQVLNLSSPPQSEVV